MRNRSVSLTQGAWLLIAVLSSISDLALAEPGEPHRPLFDGHIHYNRPVWNSLPPRDAVDRLDSAGIHRALVSSTPTAGTEKLYALAPDRIVPLLRPYDAPADRRTWFEDPELNDRLAAQLTAFPYRGIGEFHVFGENASTPVMARMIRMAVERDLFLHAHADCDAIERILDQAGGLTVIWAHAGFDVPIVELAAMLDRRPNLLLELSYRNDIAPRGKLDPRWRKLFIDYPDRFLVGMDTHVDDRWDRLGDLAQAARQWLDQLPAAVAQRIASGNAAALAGRR